VEQPRILDLNAIGNPVGVAVATANGASSAPTVISFTIAK
jgi:hypothetical protein